MSQILLRPSWFLCSVPVHAVAQFWSTAVLMFAFWHVCCRSQPLEGLNKLLQTERQILMFDANMDINDGRSMIGFLPVETRHLVV